MCLITSPSWIPTKLWGLMVFLQNLFEFHLSVWLYLLQNLLTKVFFLPAFLNAAIVTPVLKSPKTTSLPNFHPILVLAPAGFLKALGKSGISTDS